MSSRAEATTTATTSCLAFHKFVRPVREVFMTLLMGFHDLETHLTSDPAFWRLVTMPVELQKQKTVLYCAGLDSEYSKHLVLSKFL